MPGPTIYPNLRYRDPRAAIEWLKAAFGLEEVVVAPGEGDAIPHAEMRYADGVIMLGSANEFGRSPRDLGGTSGSVYVVIEDPDEHYARAKAAGAKIIGELREDEDGFRGYSARDPEGHAWSFGTYRVQVR